LDAVNINIETDFRPALDMIKRLEDRLQGKIIARTLNKIGDETRSKAATEIYKEFNLPKAKINSSLRVVRASAYKGRMQVEIEAFSRKGGRSLNVINFMTVGVVRGVAFKARGAKVKKAQLASLAGQLGFQFKRAGGIKRIEGSFIGNKGRTVFSRVTGETMKSRAKYAGTKHGESIEPVQVIDVPQMFNTKRISRTLTDNIYKRFNVVFGQEFKSVMAGY
jgi:hypothetical protein